MEFSRFDARRYRTVSVREGYSEWARSYEDTVRGIPTHFDSASGEPVAIESHLEMDE